MQISHALCSTCWRSGPQSRGSGTTRPEKNNHPPGLVGRGDLMADFTIMVGGEGGGGGCKGTALPGSYASIFRRSQSISGHVVRVNKGGFPWPFVSVTSQSEMN